MEKEIKLIKKIHGFIRGTITWEESLELLEEIVGDPHWMDILWMDAMLVELAASSHIINSSIFDANS